MAWVRLLPGVELRVGTNYDSNSFLYNSHWVNGGVTVTKNLFELIAAPRAIRFAETGIETAHARRLALSMAVLAQVHISLQRFGLAREMLDAASSLYRVDEKLSVIASDGARQSNASEFEALEARSRQVVSGLQYYAAYADAQAAYGRVLNSVGAHRLPDDLDKLDVKSLAGQLRGIVDSWQPGWGRVEVAGL